MNQSFVESTINISEPQIKTYNELFIPKGNLLESYQYPENSCEIIAKAVQNEYNGYLIFIAPLKTSSETWIKERYAGHWLNQIYYNNETIFIDYQNQEVYNDEMSLHDGMLNMMKNKFSTDDIDIKIYTYSVDVMPYSINWN